MKVNHYLFNDINVEQRNFFNKGSIFKGKIVDVFGTKILIEVKGNRIIPAILDSSVKIDVGDELTFLVKSSHKDEIHIKPIHQEEVEKLNLLKDNKSYDSISNLLKKMDVQETKTSIEIVKNLIKSNITLSKDNINNGIKIVDKLMQLSSLSEDEKVILINEPKLENQIKTLNNIINEKTIQKNTENIVVDDFKIKSKNVQISTNIDKIISLKSNIKNLLIITNNSNNEEKDLTNSIKEIMSETRSINQRDNLPKLITFFIKNNIRPSLSNILNIIELNKSPNQFVEKLNNLQQLIKKELNQKELEGILSFERMMIDEKTKHIDDKYLEIQKTIEKIKSSGKLEIEKEIVNLKDKIDFLGELNKNVLFNLIPIEYKKYNLNGIMNFIKKKNKETKDNKMNVFISLNTKKLGNIRVSCNFNGSNLSLKISMESKCFDLFKNNEHILVEKLSNVGYQIHSINYILDKDIEIIDTIEASPNPNPTYYLDVKV